jgi:hypothetical protein
MARFRCPHGHPGPFQLNVEVACGWVARVDTLGEIRVGSLEYVEPSGAVWVLSCRAPDCDWATEPTSRFSVTPYPLALAEGVWDLVTDLVTDLRPRRRGTRQGGTRER